MPFCAFELPQIRSIPVPVEHSPTENGQQQATALEPSYTRRMPVGVGVGVRWKVCTSILAGLAPMLAAAPAGAQDNWEIPGFDTVGAGAFLGYAFGGDRGLEWG